MFSIKNKTTKIVGIAGEVVLPGESIEVNDEIANGEVVKVLSGLGKLAVEKIAVKKKPDQAKADAEANAVTEKKAAEDTKKAAESK